MTNRIDIQNVRPWLVSWFIAALSYAENEIAGYVTAILRMKCHFQGTEDGSEFFGIALDEKNGRAYLGYRGTDGYTKEGNMRSWVTDFRIRTSGDGVADGMQECGDHAFDSMKHYLYDFDEVVIGGQSKGAGVTPYLGCLCAENIGNLRRIEMNSFASPPTGNQIFADRFNRHVATGHPEFTARRYVNGRDPIASPLLRMKIPPLNGVDVGELIELPLINRYKLGPFDAVNHSCAQYNAAIAVMLCNDEQVTFDEYRLVGLIDKYIVN